MLFGTRPTSCPYEAYPRIWPDVSARLGSTPNLVAGFSLRRGIMAGMQPFLKGMKHFIHDLDPPGRLSRVPPSVLVGCGLFVIGVVIAILAMWAARGARK